MNTVRAFGHRLLGGHRRRAVMLTATAAIASKTVTFVLLFAVVPLTLPLLGPERFGVLMTILGYGVLFSFVDLGVGSALIRETARSNALEGRERLATMLASGLLLLLLLGATASALLFVLIRWIPVDAIFLRLPPEFADQTRRALMTFAVLFGIALPLQGLQKIYQGFQQAYLTHTASAVLTVIALCVVRFLPAEQLSMSSIVFWVYGLPAFAPLLFLPKFCLTQLRGASLQWNRLHRHATQLLRAGSLYLFLQVAYVLGWGIDGSLSSAVLGASAAGTLAVVQRMFQLVTVPLSLMNAPLWPAYSDAAARGDRAFVRLTLARSMAFTSIIAASAGLLLIVFRAEVVDVWFGHHLAIPTSLVLLAATMATLEATGNAFAMYLNGLHVLKPQLAVAAGFMLLSIPLKYELVRSLGIEGLLVSTILCYLACVVVPYSTFFRRSAFGHVRKAPVHV